MVVVKKYSQAIGHTLPADRRETLFWKIYKFNSLPKKLEIVKKKRKLLASLNATGYDDYISKFHCLVFPGATETESSKKTCILKASNGKTHIHPPPTAPAHNPPGERMMFHKE